LGVSHGGFGSKLHLATEGGGMPIGFVLTAGFRNECPTFEPLLACARRVRRRLPRKLAADKGYSSDAIRNSLRRRRVEAVIPMRHNEHVQDRPKFDKQAYRGRNVVERCVGRLKNFRRIATRYEKLAGNFAGMITLAMIVLYLRLPL
jgi:transposase